ncbi:unnamed protein product [Lasius platythorax]|uniref:Uncharacterized protein n=1 Tax=Lasius platythorax TaxID=488582 RepID=A0AAV2N7B0_9HYME
MRLGRTGISGDATQAGETMLENDVSGQHGGCPKCDDRAMSRTRRRFRSPPGRFEPEPSFGRFWKRIPGKVQEPRRS